MWRRARGSSTSARSGTAGRRGRRRSSASRCRRCWRTARDGAIYAALNLGHFGCKLHRSDDGGKSWEELPAPAYPAEEAADAPALEMIWALAAGGADAPGEIWAGTLPGGLFVSRDRGASWALVEALWAKPERKEWFGGGYDFPGIHSILVDPRDPSKLTVGVSCGGVWKSDDRGASWRLAGKGLRAAYMPPERAYDAAYPGPAPDRGLRRGAGGGLVPASQRHVPLDRRRGELRRDRGAGAVGLRLRRGAAPGRSVDRLVRAGGQGRVPGAGGRAAGGDADPRRGRELRGARRRAAGGGELGSRLSPRAGGGCERRAAGDGVDHRQSLGERHRRRELGAGGRPPAADRAGGVPAWG